MREAAGVAAAAVALLPEAADPRALLRHAQPQQLAQLLRRRLVELRLVRTGRAPHVAAKREQRRADTRLKLASFPNDHPGRIPQLRLQTAHGELLRQRLAVGAELLLLALLLLLLLRWLLLVLLLAVLRVVLLTAIHLLALLRPPLLAARLLVRLFLRRLPVTPLRRATTRAGFRFLLRRHPHGGRPSVVGRRDTVATSAPERGAATPRGARACKQLPCAYLLASRMKVYHPNNLDRMSQ